MKWPFTFDTSLFTPQMNPLYKASLPNVNKFRTETHGRLLTQIWRPRQQLRSTLNTKLVNIARDIRAEQTAYKNFIKNNKCRHICVGIGNHATVHHTIYDKDKCQNTFTLPSNKARVNLCTFPPPYPRLLKPVVSDEAIMNLKHHETADLGLVCVHIRVGSTTFHDHHPEMFFSDISKLPVVWDFLRTYVKRGHHVYLATDTQQVSACWENKQWHQ